MHIKLKINLLDFFQNCLLLLFCCVGLIARMIIRLLSKLSSFAFLLRWIACSNAHLCQINCASRCTIRLAKKQNTRFEKKSIDAESTALLAAQSALPKSKIVGFARSLLLLLLCLCSTATINAADSEKIAHQLFIQQKYKQAAQLFKDSQWKGIAYYRARDYQQALYYFVKDDSPLGWYNQGNALAKLHQYAQALAAYEKVLKVEPDNADARVNRDLMKKLLDNKNNNSGNDKNSDDRNNNNNADNNKKNNEHNQQNQDNNQNQTQHNQQNHNSSDKDETNNSNQSPASAPDEANHLPDEQQGNSNTSASNDSHQNTRNEPPPVNTQWQNPSANHLSGDLNDIPDAPQGLLKRKFLRDYHLRQHDGIDNDKQ